MTASGRAVRDWRFWGLLGLFVLVVSLHLATPYLDADQAVTGLMGRQVLAGEFPIFYWRQEHAGVPEAYAAAVTFALFGMSRVALNLVPALGALGLLLVLYRTGAVLFGHEAGLLAMLFATVVSPYVAGHYVLARAYYIEQLLAGQLVLLGAALCLRHGPAEPWRSRVLLAMGLAGGVGLYCGFQIVYALVPGALALLLADPGLPRRRGAWLALLAFLLASTPFWIYNLVHGWATVATGARFAGDQPAGQAARLIAGELFPVLLGVTDDGLKPYLPRPLGLAIPAAAAAAVALLAVRVVRGARRLREDPALAGEALLLAAGAVTLGAVWTGRYVGVPRYLLPLAPQLALILARAAQLVGRRCRPLAVALAALYLVAVGAGLLADLTLFRPRQRAAYWKARAEDAQLFAFLRARGLTRVYALDYWLAPRLTFDSGGEIVVAQPFGDRHPPSTRAVDASPRPAFVLKTGSGRLAAGLASIGADARLDRIGHYTVFWGFTAPPPVVPLPRAGWTVRASPGPGAPERVVDGRLGTGWAGIPDASGAAWLEVDLGGRRTVTGVTVLTDGLERLPRAVEVAAVDDGAEPRVLARLETGGVGLTWRNGAPRAGPGPALELRFPPREVRRLRVTGEAPGRAFPVTELFALAPGDGPSFPAEAVEAGRRLEAAGQARAALRRYWEAMRATPDRPDGYAEFVRLAGELGVDTGSPDELAALYARLGLVDAARDERRRLVVPPDAPPGLYRILLGVRDPTTGHRVRPWRGTLLPMTGHLVDLGVLEILPAS